jgi:hypothetical protein
MANESEVINQQMRETRAALTDKLETLERQVTGTIHEVSQTVENVKGAVHETVQNVRGSVSEGVEAVKSTFDLKLQTQRHPWAMFGGSVAVGCLGGYLLGKGDRGASRRSTPASQEGVAHPNGRPGGGRQPSWIDQITETFRPELNQLKEIAIGSALSLVRDVVVRSLPEELAPKVAEVVDNVTGKLGGQPVRGPVLEPQHGHSAWQTGTSSQD